MNFILTLLRFAKTKAIAINVKSIEKTGDYAIILNDAGVPVAINPDFRLIYKFPWGFEVIYMPESSQEKNLGVF